MSDKHASLGRERLQAHESPLAREREIARLAGRQHGLVTTAQLNALGFSNQAIAVRGAAGRLHRLHRGVYSVGHTIVTVAGHRLAAVLASGGDALASHTMAAAIWGVRPDHGRLRHVTTERGGRSRPGVRVHRAPDLATADRTLRDRIPVTSLARTLVDLGDVVKPDHVRAAFIRAEQLRLLDMKTVDEALARASRRPGPAILREVLRGYDPRWQATRSPLELRLLDAVAGRGLPEPEVNEWVDGRYMVDFLWRDHRVIVETDGNQAHGTDGARRRDARRERELRLRGFKVLRVTHRELTDDPTTIVQTIRSALSTVSDAAAAARVGDRQAG